MITPSDIKHLSIQEKLHLIETLWHQISADEDQLKIPESHKKMLDKREAMEARGEAEFLDWQQAKNQIHKAIQ
ncbi:MAG: addiction module protein [Balneolaceae bacterium]|nr:addiction module protein [Balneolaceae bacterium]